MLVTRLTVVNACLASMGEEPINSLAETNAFVNSALFALEQATANEQSAGWWYNKEVLELYPDAAGEYPIPADVIDLDIDSNPQWLVIRSARLYSTAEAKRLVGTRSYHANIIRLLNFDDLPFHAKRVVKAATVLLFQQAYDGDAQKIKEAESEYAMAYQLQRSQHIRAVKANFSTSAARVGYMHGGSMRLRTPR